MNIPITVIVPNYNKQDYIIQCLQSIADQTYKDFECIVVDDGSTDSSIKIISQFCSNDNRFKLYLNQNHGLAYSRNFGIQHANGKYILPIDADDWIELTYVERAMKFFDQHPEFTLFYGKWLFTGYNADMMNARLGNLHYQSYATLLRSNSIHCSCVYRRDDAIECGMYDVNMKAYEDWEFLIRLLHNKHLVCYDPHISLYYRQFEQSMSSYGHQHYGEIYNYIMTKNKKIYQEIFS